MRLIQTDGQGNIIGEVKTFDPIGGVYDAVRVASQQAGDGVFWADTGDGKYYEFTVENGQAHNLTEDGWKSGAPGDILDNSDMAERIQRPASEFGGFFLDPDANEGPAVNFLMPDVSDAVAAREAAEAEAQAAAEAEATEEAAETAEETPEEAAAEGEAAEGEEVTDAEETGDETETAEATEEAEDAETDGEETAEVEGDEEAAAEGEATAPKQAAEGETAAE